MASLRPNRPRNPVLRALAVAGLAAALAGCGDAPERADGGPQVNPPEGPFASVAGLAAPTAEKRPVEIVAHETLRVDNYGWLRDDNWQEVLRDPSVLKADIRAHLEAENAYFEAASAHLDPLRATLVAEMRGRLKEDDSTVPAPDGPYAYYRRYREGGEYPVYARTPRDGGPEEILLDGDAERGDAAFFAIGGVEHSPDHRLVAFGTDRLGSEYFEIRVRDIETGEMLPDAVANADRSIVWAADSGSFFYVERDDNQRPRRVRRHVLGAGPATDEIVYEEEDESFFLGVYKTQSGAFVVIDASKGTSGDARVLPADAAPGTPPRLIAPREDDMLYSVEHRGDDFYIHTNADGAVDFKIVRAPVADPGRANWEDWLPAREGVFVRAFLPFADRAVRLESVDALPRIVVSDWSLEDETEIDFDEAAFALGLAPGYEFDTDILRFTYESPARPEETWDYAMTSGARTLLKTQEIPSGHDPSRYRVERIFARAEDGAEIPVTILAPADVSQDGSAPLLLYGYGSYGVTIPANFSSNVLSMVDRGVVFAIGHVRGGAAKGRQWYLDGKLDKKPNSFTDFVAVAETLHAEGWSSPARTVIYGGSAGGLLVGATVNLRPDLFAGVIGAVPFVDVLNTISDPELPLTPPEWVEWGDPIADAAAFMTIAGYSPYDNIRTEIPYPPILATAGLADYRVTYWEPAKWTARLRDEAQGGPFFLKTNMEAGHAGAAARFERLKEVADYYSFALEIFGLADAPGASD